jgi:hypothetical protein
MVHSIQQRQPIRLSSVAPKQANSNRFEGLKLDTIRILRDGGSVEMRGTNAAEENVFAFLDGKPRNKPSATYGKFLDGFPPDPQLGGKMPNELNLKELKSLQQAVQAYIAAAKPDDIQLAGYKRVEQKLHKAIEALQAAPVKAAAANSSDVFQA